MAFAGNPYAALNQRILNPGAPQQQQQGSNPFTDPTGNRTFTPGQTLPNQPNDRPIPQANPGASTEARQAFMPPELLAPFYNAQGVNANLGSMFAASIPGTMDFINQQMSPNLNQMERAFLDTSAQDAAELMERMMVQQEGQFHNTPFHSYMPQQQAQVFDQFNRNLLNQGSQLALQRMSNATQLAPIPIAGLQQSLDYGPQISERLFNLSNQAFKAPYEIPLNVYSQLPFNAPTLVQEPESGGGK